MPYSMMDRILVLQPVILTSFSVTFEAGYPDRMAGGTEFDGVGGTWVVFITIQTL